VNNHLVAVWAHCLGTTVTAAAATAFTFATSTAATAPAASSVVAFGHSHLESGVLFHDEEELLAFGVEFRVQKDRLIWFVRGRDVLLGNILPRRCK
jgi:hypothetical protein